MEKTDVFAACDSLLQDAVQLSDLQGSFALMHIFSFICKMQEKIFSPPIKEIKLKNTEKPRVNTKIYLLIDFAHAYVMYNY